MQNHFLDALNVVSRTLLAADAAPEGATELKALELRILDAVHHVCIADVLAEDDRLGEFACREAYLSVLTLAKLATTPMGVAAVEALLDAIEPFVSPPEVALRAMEKLPPEERWARLVS